MKIKTLRQLFEHELHDLHSAESQIIKALPKMIEEATDEDLKAALQEHLEVTEEQLARIEKIHDDLGIPMENVPCDGIKGIIMEGEKALKEIEDPVTKDVAIIGAAQRVEHYEMAAYMGASMFAEKLGLDDAAEMLTTTLEEEKDADASLAALAEGGLIQSGLADQAVDEQE